MQLQRIVERSGEEIYQAYHGSESTQKGSGTSKKRKQSAGDIGAVQDAESKVKRLECLSWLMHTNDSFVENVIAVDNLSGAHSARSVYSSNTTLWV